MGEKGATATTGATATNLARMAQVGQSSQGVHAGAEGVCACTTSLVHAAYMPCRTCVSIVTKLVFRSGCPPSCSYRLLSTMPSCAFTRSPGIMRGAVRCGADASMRLAGTCGSAPRACSCYMHGSSSAAALPRGLRQRQGQPAEARPGPRGPGAGPTSRGCGPCTPTDSGPVGQQLPGAHDQHPDTCTLAHAAGPCSDSSSCPTSTDTGHASATGSRAGGEAAPARPYAHAQAQAQASHVAVQAMNPLATVQRQQQPQHRQH